MQFKVGQRVKKVAMSRHGGANFIPIGAEGVITALGHYWIPRIDEHGNDVYTVAYDGHEETGACGYMLAPLTPPAQDAWAADKVRELVKPKPMDAEREETFTVRVGDQEHEITPADLWRAVYAPRTIRIKP